MRSRDGKKTVDFFSGCSVVHFMPRPHRVRPGDFDIKMAVRCRIFSQHFILQIQVRPGLKEIPRD